MTAWNTEFNIPLNGLFGFSPFTADGLVGGYEADIGITLNGSDVSGWADQSGVGNDLGQTTGANQPLFNSIDANFNGQSSISFNGTTDFLFTSLYAAALSQPNSIIAVMKRASTAANRIVFDGQAVGNRNALTSQDIGTTEGIFGGAAVIKGGTADTNPHIMTSLFNTTASSLFMDGGIAIATGSIGTHTLTGLALGTSFDASNFFAGEIAALYIGNKLWSVVELNLFGNYLAKKYGITWTDI